MKLSLLAFIGTIFCCLTALWGLRFGNIGLFPVVLLVPQFILLWLYVKLLQEGK